MLRRCLDCRAYTLQEACPRCGGTAETAHPARFSPDDTFSEDRIEFYRRNPEISPMNTPGVQY